MRVLQWYSRAPCSGAATNGSLTLSHVSFARSPRCQSHQAVSFGCCFLRRFFSFLHCESCSKFWFLRFSCFPSLAPHMDLLRQDDCWSCAGMLRALEPLRQDDFWSWAGMLAIRIAEPGRVFVLSFLCSVRFIFCSTL